jgi:hypothetical protein
MSKVITTASPERAEELRRMVGDPAEVAQDLARFREAAAILSSNQPRLIDEYPERWVAVYGQNILDAESLSELYVLLSDHDVPREHAIIRYIERNARVLFL